MTVKPAYFWCNHCRAWTRVEDSDHPATNPGFWCSICGDDYVCDECGYDIDRTGECQRPEGHAEPRECQGHPAGPSDPMGRTVYCDGSCQEVAR